jgi:hypothetical protein
MEQQDFPSDILLSTPAGRIARVEIKNVSDLSPGRAQSLRKSILSFAPTAPTRFFLLLSQDVGYLWRENKPVDAPADVEFSMRQVLERHFDPQLFQDRLRESELKTLIFFWLADLAKGAPADTDPPLAELEKAGFVDAIRGSTAVMEPAA